MRELSLAAKLHDIGKVGVPDAILNKPAALTHAENLVVRQHPDHRRTHPALDRSQSLESWRPSAVITSASTATAIPTA